MLVSGLETWLKSSRNVGQISLDSSEQAYRDIWAVFVKWCLSQTPTVQLTSLSVTDLQNFIDTRAGRGDGPSHVSWTPRYIWRFLHLVDRVTAHMASSTGSLANSAAREVLIAHPQWQHANAAHQDLLPEHLNAGQAGQLVAFLNTARPRPGREAVSLKWQELRNRCGVALQLGAGLTPAEVRSLLVTEVVVERGARKGIPWKIEVPQSAVTPSREAPVLPWAARLLQYWMDSRAGLAIAGPYLLPSTKAGKAWGKVSQYESVAKVLSDAGLAPHVVQGGSYRLRHTFALRQLRRGISPEEVAKCLGIVDPGVMARYRRVLPAPARVIV